MGRSIGLFLSIIIGLTAALAFAQTSQIKHVRVGGHKTYDRLVVELSSPAGVKWEMNRENRELVFDIDAAPLHSQTLATGLRRLGTLRVEKTPGGTRIRIPSKPRRTRVFRLGSPDRIVIDLAEPSSTPFVAPRGTQAIAQSGGGAPAVVATKTEKTPVAKRPVAEKPAAEKTAPIAKVPAAKPMAKTTPEQTAKKTPVQVAKAKPEPTFDPDARNKRRSPFAPPTGELIDRSLKNKPVSKPTEPLAKAPEKKTVPAQEAKAPPSARAGAPTRRPAPEPTGTLNPPRPAPPQAPLSEGQGIWIAMIALGVLGAIGVGFWVWHSQKGEEPVVQRADTVRGSPVIITQEELRDGPRVELLDKRLDEEVRARMQLEERMQQANEEIKVLRDRLARIERRRGA